MKLAVILGMVLALGVAGCQRKEPAVKVDKQESVVEKKAPKEKLSLDSLDRRVSAVEARNARVDARAAAAKAKVKVQ